MKVELARSMPSLYWDIPGRYRERRVAALAGTVLERPGAAPPQIAPPSVWCRSGHIEGRGRSAASSAARHSASKFSRGVLRKQRCLWAGNLAEALGFR